MSRLAESIADLMEFAVEASVNNPDIDVFVSYSGHVHWIECRINHKAQYTEGKPHNEQFEERVTLGDPDTDFNAVDDMLNRAVAKVGELLRN